MLGNKIDSLFFIRIDLINGNRFESEMMFELVNYFHSLLNYIIVFFFSNHD